MFVTQKNRATEHSESSLAEGMISQKEKDIGYTGYLYETLIKVASELVWLWVTTEPEYRLILSLSSAKISKESNKFVLRRILSDGVKIHEKHPVYIG